MIKDREAGKKAQADDGPHFRPSLLFIDYFLLT
jgi:hypothetical protein